MQTPRLSATAGTLLLHALAVAGAFAVATEAPVREDAKPLEVSLVVQEPAPLAAETPPEPLPPPPVPPPPPPPKAVAPKTPPKPREKPVEQVKPTPAPAPAPEPVAMAPAATESSQSTIAAEPAPPATPVAEVVAPPPPPRTAPREDASWAGNVKPPYPALARRLGEQGQVVLEVLVAEDGSAVEVKIKRSSGSTVLDKAARETALKWRFKPATVGGKPVAEWYTLPFHFNLDA